MAQRSARREARPRAEADAGHRKRALLPLPARKTKRAFAILYYASMRRRTNDSCNARPAQGLKRMQGTARGRCFRFPHERPKRAFAILYYVSQDKRIVQHELHLPVIGNAARLHANELRPFLILLPYHNSRQPGDDLLRAVCCFFRFTKLN